MASSGSELAVFRREGERLAWVCTVPVPSCNEGVRVLGEVGAEILRAGSWAGMRYRLGPSSLDSLRRRRRELVELRRAFVQRRRVELEVAWELEQQRRAGEEAEDAVIAPDAS